MMSICYFCLPLQQSNKHEHKKHQNKTSTCTPYAGMGKNVPVSIIIDELPTLYFHKIDRLIGTARSNKVSVTMAFL